MIPKASQRGGGQDLAAHLMNAFDNEYVEVAEVSGAVAPDLHGAFAEWEAIASSLTKCRNYLYSLSVNPDLAQGPLTRTQYMDYADRVEEKLGLAGQPRVMVFHIKDGREHCHIVWSRIDDRSGKAIHLAFDHDKLMMVTREFARDHGLALPEGYERDLTAPGKSRHESLHERAQERQTGLTKEERMQMVTHAWKSADSPRAFVRALEELGYVLATGNRPYVLVDMYGGMNALPKLIDDRQVKTKDIRAFLEKEFPADQLPSVEEAKALVAAHRKTREDFAKARDDGQRKDRLLTAQARRREGVVAAHELLLEGQRQERAALAREQLAARWEVRQAYLAEARAIRAAREAGKATGLAAFLGRVTGYALMRRKIDRYRDGQRLVAYRERKDALMGMQARAAHSLRERHRLQALDSARTLKGLAAVERRELQSLEVKRVREQREKERAGHHHMPALKLALKPRGRSAVPHKARDRYRDKLAVPEERKARLEQPEHGAVRDSLREKFAPDSALTRAPDARDAFTRAAEGESDSGGSGTGESGQESIRPASRASRASRRSERGDDRPADRRGRGRGEDFERER